MVFSDHPCFEDTVQQCCADTATSSTSEQDKQVVREHREACGRVDDAIQETCISTTVFISQLTDERGTESTRNKSTSIESSNCRFRQVFVVFVECVDMRSLLRSQPRS
jgi:hypothetical protein